MAAANQNTADEADDLVKNFSAALGNGGKGAVKVYEVVDKKRSFIEKYPLESDNIEEFLDWLRAKYIRGGEFYLSVIDEKGRTLTNQGINLSDLKPDTPKLPANIDSDARSARRDTDMFMMMMQNSQKQSSDNMQMMMAMMGNQQSSLMQMMGLIIPAITGNKESPTDVLAKLSEIQKSVSPQQTSGVKDTLELMTMVKSFLTDADPPEGIAGVVQAAAPLLAALVGGIQSQGAAPAQQQPGTVARPVNAPIGAPGGAVNVPGQAPIDAAMQVQAQLIETYRPLMSGIKQLILNDYEPEAIAGYVEMKVESGEIDAAAAKLLYSNLEGAGENLPGILALFDIIEPEHVEIIRQAVALLVAELAANGEGDGGGGDLSSSGIDEGPSY